MKRALSAAMLVAAALFTSACSQSVSSRNPHESARKTDVPALEDESTETLRDLVPASGSLPVEINAMSADDLYSKTVSPLLRQILSPAVLQSKRLTNDPKLKESLMQLNSGIIALAMKQSPKLDEALNTYETALFDGCDLSLKGCKNLSVFDKDPESASVAYLLAKRESDLQKRYALLFLGYDLGRHNPQPLLQSLYLERLGEWIKFVSGQQDRELLSRHQHLLTLILARKKEESLQTKSEGVPKWLGDLEPLSLSRVQQSALTQNMTTLLELTVHSGLYDSSDKLVTSLRNSIDRMQAEPQSFASLEKSLPESLVNGLKLPSTGERDEYFLIVDRLYQGHFNQADALALWSASNKDQARLAALIKAYVQTRMAILIDASNRHMSSLFADDSKQSDIMKRAVERAGELNESWLMFLHSADLLRELSDQTLRTSSSRTELNAELSAFFNGLKSSIKLSVTYPHMLMLAHHLSRTKYQETVNTVFGQRLIDSTLVLKKLFLGIGEPWFQYGAEIPDEKPLSTTELLYAFEFAVKADVFKTFGIDAEDFLLTVFDRVMGPKLGLLKAEHQHLKQKYELTNEWTSLLNLCNAIENKKPYSNSVSLREISTAPFLGKRFKRLLEHSDGLEYDADGIKRGYFMYSRRTLDTLEFIRLDLDPNLAYFDLMIEAVAKNRKETQALSLIKGQVQAARVARDSFVNLAQKRHREFSNCYVTLMEKERAVEISILQAEAENLRQIFREMKRLAANPVETQARNERYRFTGVPGGFRGSSSFDQNTYTFSHLDELLWIKNYVERGLQTETATVNPIDANTSIEIPRNLPELFLFKDNRITPVARTDSEDEFVAAGLKAMLERDRGGDFLYWFTSERLEPYFLRNWVHAAAILHRLSPPEGAKPYVETPELVETPFKILDVVNLKGEEPFMKAANITTRAAEHTFYDLFVHRHTRELLPLLNLTYTYLALDVLGSTANDGSFAYKDNVTENQPTPPNFLPARQQAIELAKYFETRPVLAFDIGKSLDDRLLAYYGNRVKADLAKVKEFEEAAAKRFEQDRQNGTKHALHIYVGKTLVFDEYLSPVLKSNFRTTIKDFHEASSGRFR